MMKWGMGLLLALICAGCASNDSQGGPGNSSGMMRGNSEDRQVENRVSDNHRNPSTSWSNMK